MQCYSCPRGLGAVLIRNNYSTQIVVSERFSNENQLVVESWVIMSSVQSGVDKHDGL